MMIEGLLALLAIVLLLLIGVPVAFAMLAVGMAGIIVLSGPAVLLSQMETLPVSVLSIHDLSIIPLFIMMGHIASRSGLSQNLFDGILGLMSRIDGCLAYAALYSCAAFGAICGSSLATTATMSKLAFEPMQRAGYSDRLSAGVLAAGGTLGILIPPSVVLILYAVLVEVNIVTMFRAAIIPAALALALFTLVIYILRKRELRKAGCSADQNNAFAFHQPVPASLQQDHWKNIQKILPVFIIFVLVMGGLYAGLVTPVQSASLGVFLMALSDMIRRYLLKNMAGFIADYKQTLLDTALISGALYLIIVGAEVLSIFFARTGLTQSLVLQVQNSDISPPLIMIMILALLIVLGCILESLSLILLTIPFLWPVVSGLDFGLEPEELKIWFGILMLVVVELGLITPPFGMNLFILQKNIPEPLPLGPLYQGVTPFVCSEIVRIGLLLAFPALSLM
jgi:tripartite ATP-independent transporter DctM subunit